MARSKNFTPFIGLIGAIGLSACSGLGGASNPDGALPAGATSAAQPQGTSLRDILRPSDAGVNVKVNKYLWNASLEVLNFLPVESIDPFTGVIVTGFGRPPGGGRAYRATVLVSDPALEARSLNVALISQNGPVSPATARAVEDAILSRARQLRVADSRF